MDEPEGMSSPRQECSTSRGARRAHRKARHLRRYRHALVCLVLALAATWSFGQSYEWRDVVQVVSIQADGRVIVIDTRTLWTDDDFGEAFICFELGDAQIVTMLPVTGALDAGPTATAYSQPCAAGVELVVRNAERVSERRQRFAYVLDGTVDAYSDVVQWYWNLIQLDHPPVIGYRLIVSAPGSMSAPFDAFVHRYDNPETPRVALSEDRSLLTVYLDRIPSGDGVEVRYLMDPSLFEVKGHEPGLDELMRDESRVIRDSQ